MIEPLEPKTPGAKKNYGIKWGGYFAEDSPGVTITTSEWEILSELGSPDLQIITDNIGASGLATIVRLDGGEAGRDYILLNYVTTSEGEELEEPIKVRVKSPVDVASL